MSICRDVLFSFSAKKAHLRVLFYNGGKTICARSLIAPHLYPMDLTMLTAHEYEISPELYSVVHIDTVS